MEVNMEFINISNPVVLVLTLAILLGLIFVGKKLKTSYIPAGGLMILLALLIYYIVCLRSPEYEAYHSTIRVCLGINFIFIFIGFFAYLWVDDIESKVKDKKSYDNSLDWFWEKR